jgi:pectate lyase
MTDQDKNTTRVQAGKTGKTWIVHNEQVNGNYIVEYVDKDKAQTVDPDQEICTCTYSNFNDTCPHQEAVDKVHDTQDVQYVEDETGVHRVHQQNMFYDRQKDEAGWVDDYI